MVGRRHRNRLQAGVALRFALGLVLPLPMLAGCTETSPCSNRLLGERLSPNGALKAVVFQRSCAEGTVASTQVSLLPADEPLPNKAGNTLVLDSSGERLPTGHRAISLRWTGDQELVVSRSRIARHYYAPHEVGDVSIIHERL